MLRLWAAAELKDFARTLSLIMSQSKAGFIVSSFSYSCFVCLMVRFIKSMYSASTKSDVLSFQNPRPLRVECKEIFNVTKEWSVLKPGRISAELTMSKRLSLTRKKSRLQ